MPWCKILAVYQSGNLKLCRHSKCEKLKYAQNNLGSSPINDVHDNQLGLDCENLNLEKTRDMFPSSQHQCLLDKVQVCRVARRGEGGHIHHICRKVGGEQVNMFFFFM